MPNEMVDRIAKMLKEHPPGSLGIALNRHGEFSVMGVMGNETDGTEEEPPADYPHPVDKLRGFLNTVTVAESGETVLTKADHEGLTNIWNELEHPGMAGGAVHGLDSNLHLALNQALREARLGPRIVESTHVDSGGQTAEVVKVENIREGDAMISGWQPWLIVRAIEVDPEDMNRLRLRFHTDAGSDPHYSEWVVRGTTFPLAPLL